jgi:hypothetical protein
LNQPSAINSSLTADGCLLMATYEALSPAFSAAFASRINGSKERVSGVIGVLVASADWQPSSCSCWAIAVVPRRAIGNLNTNQYISLA